MSNLYQIAIDGPAAAGKSTVAKLTAKRLGAFYVNTGEMYRTIAWACLKEGIDTVNAPDKVEAALARWTMTFQNDGNGEIDIIFNGQPVVKAELRTAEVAMASSNVADSSSRTGSMSYRAMELSSSAGVIMLSPQGERSE